MKVPRSPLVLCHGLFGFDYLGPSYFKSYRFSYWHGILDYLKSKQIEVYVAKVPPIGPIGLRSYYLDRYIKSQSGLLSTEHPKGRPFIMIGHSMGGLDALYYQYSALLPNVKAIVTLATPHLGSTVADLCLEVLLGKRDVLFQPIREKDPSALTLKFFLFIIENMIDKQMLHHFLSMVDPEILKITGESEREEAGKFTQHAVADLALPEFMKLSPSTCLPHLLYTELIQQKKSLKWLYIWMSFYHLSRPFLRQLFQPNVSRDPQLYCKTYGGDIAPLLEQKRIQWDIEPSLAKANDKSSLSFYWPFNVAYPILLQEEGPNDGLVSFASSQGSSYNTLSHTDTPWSILHPNFCRRDLPSLPFVGGESWLPFENEKETLHLFDMLLEDLYQQGF